MNSLASVLMVIYTVLYIFDMLWKTASKSMLGINIAPDFSLITISFRNSLQNADGYFYSIVSDC